MPETTTEGAATISTSPPAAVDQTENASYTRSTIAFPYTPLADAERIAQALHSRSNSASTDEVAAELGTTTKSGAFRMKVSTARTFGVVDVTRGKVTLTDLGRRIVDPKQIASARVEAFLHVPLFNSIYEKYKGGLLPPNQGLETAIADLGVSPKQTERARQTLQRSAERAGFFRNGTDRLVAPPTSGIPEGEPKPAGPIGTVDSMAKLSPMMVEMWLTLLRGEGKNWPPEKVAEWVKQAQKLDTLLSASN